MTTVPIIPGTATIVLDGSGNGTAKIGPLTAREIWNPSVASVSVATNVKEAQCKVYIGDRVTQSNFIDGTLSGSTGDSTDRVSGSEIRLGRFIWAVWSNGDANAVATLNITGQKTI